MRILWIGGNHPRHLYYINRINQNFRINGAIIMGRESMLPHPPEGTEEHDKYNFIKHFENRDDAERRYFGSQNYPDCEILEVKDIELNSNKSVEFIEDKNPDVVLIFGCDLIKEPLISALPFYAINLHLGLSPRYRGSATLFWPFYFMEPNQAGSTIHLIVLEPDAGAIIHHVVPGLQAEDKIHDVACKTVIASAEATVRILQLLEEGKEIKLIKQKNPGKLFLSSDFRPEHLRVIYDIFNDEMVRYYLEGRIKPKQPNLFNQFNNS